MTEQRQKLWDKLASLSEEIRKMLDKEELFAEVDFQMDVEKSPGGIVTNSPSGIVVSIEWGDWKHQHLRAKYLIGNKFGLECADSRITEENGSDCYSAIHFFPYPAIKRMADGSMIQEVID